MQIPILFKLYYPPDADQLRAYRHANGQTIIEIDGCPLELSRYGLWRIFLEPAAGGIRIATFDGYVESFSRFVYVLIP